MTTFFTIHGSGAQWIIGGILMTAMMIGLLLMFCGGIWLCLLLFSKAEEAIIFRLRLNRECVAFMWRRAAELRARLAKVAKMFGDDDTTTEDG